MKPSKTHKPPQKTLQEQLPELREGQSVELLKELHILTREGKLNQDTRRKLKQVYHLVQFIEPLLASVLKERGDVTLADHGAGKSYLGFILYDLFFKDKAVGHVYGVESRTELVDKSRALAQRLGLHIRIAVVTGDDVLPRLLDTSVPDAALAHLEQAKWLAAMVPADRVVMSVDSLVGMLHAVRFQAGRVSYRNRWVRTEKFELEKAAGRRLFGMFGNPMTTDPSVQGKHYNTGNTNLILHGGKLLALMEGSLKVAKTLLDLSGTKVDTRSKNDETPLMMAAFVRRHYVMSPTLRPICMMAAWRR